MRAIASSSESAPEKVLTRAVAGGSGLGRGKEELINRSMEGAGRVSARVSYARRRPSSSSSSSAVSICLVGSLLWGVRGGDRNVRVEQRDV